MTKEKLKSEKGISLIALCAAIIILAIISSILVYQAQDGVDISEYNNLKNDISVLEDSVGNYYRKYGGIPAYTTHKYTNIQALEQANALGANDNSNYYVIDLSAMEGITLNYGKDYEKIDKNTDPNSYTNIYIINEQSHQIYYPQGVTVDGVTYYSFDKDDNEITTIENEFDKNKGVNRPKLSQGMIPIKWDSTDSTWVICEETDQDWYNYVDQAEGQDGQSKWANVMLGDGKYKTAEGNVGKTVGLNDLGSMFVWIPRYAYSITSLYHTSSTEGGDIEIAFLEGTKEYPVGTEVKGRYHGDTVKGIIKNESGQGNWNEHPAFSFGGTTLAGIWMAKFEAGNANCTTNVSTGATSYSSKAIKVQPDKTSWRNITVSNIYDVCREMQTKYSTTYGISTDTSVIDTHMMKNSEWGAVAYLAQSSYGRNKHEVEINDGSGMVTGDGNYESNVGQSTTKNVTGI